MTRAARRLFGAGLILTAVAVAWVGELSIAEANEGCSTMSVCVVSK